MEAYKFILEIFSKQGIAYLLLIIVLFGVYKIIMRLLDVMDKQQHSENINNEK